MKVYVENSVQIEGTVQTNGLTDGQLRATPVPVAGPLTDLQLRANAVPVQQAGVSATGSVGALNASLLLALNGQTGFAVDVRGTFTATLLIQGTVDGTNWITLSVLPIGAALNIAQVAQVTAAGAWWGNANGLFQVRVTVSAYTSGSATVTIRAMQSAGMVFNLPVGQTTQQVSAVLTTGAAAIGDVGQQYRANATGAASRTHLVSGAGTNATIVRNAAARLVGWQVSNTNAAWRYVKLHNTATAPTAGSGVVQTIAVPPNSTVNHAQEGGIAFTTGIGMTTTIGAADADTAAVGANDLIIDLFWA